MGEFVRLEVDRDRRVGTIRLERPPMNAISFQVWREIGECAAEAAEHDDVGAIVVWGGPNLELWPNPLEVASVHRIPLTELLREDAPRLDPGDDGGHPVLRMPVGDNYIAAPTAAILYQFREVCLLGRPTRVAHFEQPRFAWR